MGKETMKEPEKEQSETFKVNQERKCHGSQQMEFPREEKSPVSGTAERSIFNSSLNNPTLNLLVLVRLLHTY